MHERNIPLSKLNWKIKETGNRNVGGKSEKWGWTWTGK